MAIIYTDVDIDIVDYLDEVSDEELIDELNDRGYKIDKKKRSTQNKDEYEFPEFKTTMDLKKFIYAAFGLKTWHTKERLLKEIDELY